ncbi:MAG: hypothetical protein AAFV93_12885, partial [Chloroflexota bacterium]
FERVGMDTYPLYQREHMVRITILVLPLMLTELITAIVLAVNPPDGVPRWSLWIALGAVLAIWGMTAFVNAPQHGQLSAQFDTQIHQALLSTNWVRTILWTGRGIFVTWLLWLLINN